MASSFRFILRRKVMTLCCGRAHVFDACGFRLPRRDLRFFGSSRRLHFQLCIFDMKRKRAEDSWRQHVRRSWRCYHELGFTSVAQFIQFAEDVTK